MAGKLSFSRRVTSSFLLLSLVTVAMVSSVAFWRAREALKQAAYDRLNVTATLKEQEIARWLEACERDFLVITQFPDVRRSLQTLLAENARGRAAAESTLRPYLQEVARLQPKFSEIFVIDRSNRIVLSTDPSREGQYEIATNLTYFEAVVDGEEFAPVFYVSPVDGKPAVTYAAPIRDGSGQRQGVVLAHLNLERIDQIVRESTGLGITGETYLVGSLAEQTAFISRRNGSAPAGPPHSVGIDQAMQARSGQGLYDSYAGVPVIGVYRWLSGQDLALLVEMAQTEAFQPARRLAGTIVVVGLGSAAILCVGVLRLARQLSQSRRQLEEYSQRLEGTAQKAQAANRAKSEFLANMSHELRTPLNAILGFTQLMSCDRNLSPEHQNRVQIISRSGEHLLALINDVLSMAKIEAGRTSLNPKSFDLHELLLSLEDMLRIKAEAKGLTLQVQRHPCLPRYVAADEGKLRQVLVNLLGNAIKFTPQGLVTLEVSAATADSSNPLPLRFTVTDTGPGIATADQSQLFDPFFQTARSQDSPQGTGLGLAISQRFIQLMGGEITVKSTLGQGACFSFTIPVTVTATATAALTPAVVQLLPGQPYRVLIVDDDDASRRLLAEILTGAGFTVQEAGNGAAALDNWRQWQPHLIWMDMRMPVMDGYEATRKIRKEEGTGDRGQGVGDAVNARDMPSPLLASSSSTTKIIALTASAFEEEQTAILACGCDDFVRKPLQISQIFDKLAQHLGVRYRYEEAAAAAEPALATQAVALSTLTHRWVAQLQEAAVQADADAIYGLLETITETHPVLAAQLRQLTQSFDFDTLLDLAEAALGQLSPQLQE